MTIDISRLDIRVVPLADSWLWTIHEGSTLLAEGEHRFGFEAWAETSRWCEMNGFRVE